MSETKININIHQSDVSKPIILSCDTCWSVKKLKEVIQNVHASRPEINRQTLIYKGRCLGDAEKLSSFLLMTDSKHTIQLGLSLPEVTPIVQSGSNFTDGIRHRHSSSSSESSPWQHWQQWQNYPHYQQPSTPEQYAAMWQQYQQQVNNFMQYYNNQTPDKQPSSNQPTTTTDGTAPPAADPNPPAAPAQAPPANAPAQAPPANAPDPPMNAQGGFAPADNDDLAPHDWLDVVFTLFRYSFFLSIIYFYSTFWRFLLVAGFFLILYVYQSGLFRAQRRPPRPDEVRRENAREPEPDVIDDNNNQNDDDDVDVNSEEHPAPPPPPPSIFATAWCFITTFFTSLIPQPPPVV